MCLLKKENPSSILVLEHHKLLIPNLGAGHSLASVHSTVPVLAFHLDTHVCNCLRTQVFVFERARSRHCQEIAQQSRTSNFRDTCKTFVRIRRTTKLGRRRSGLLMACQCAERRPPGLTTPGNLKEATEFNDKVFLDGFDRESKNGLQVYAVHVFDEATRFHLGQRTQREVARAIQLLKQNWFQWAGRPNHLAHDQAGEFMTEKWKKMLQENGIRPSLPGNEASSKDMEISSKKCSAESTMKSPPKI